MSLLNPVALITGAASGIGAACARDLARKATGGLILVDADADGLAATADALPAAPERVSTLAFDVADAARWAQAAAFINAQYGRLDWAIVNADAVQSGGAQATVEDWRHAIGVNLDTAFLCLRSLMPLMRMNTEGGAIVVTGSADSINPEPSAPSKAGLIQFIRVAAKEGAPDSIRVNAVAPAGAENGLWRNAPTFQDLARETGSERAALDKVAGLAPPLARYAGEDVTRLIILLLTENSAITGATLVAEGGYTL